MRRFATRRVNQMVRSITMNCKANRCVAMGMNQTMIRGYKTNTWMKTLQPYLHEDSENNTLETQFDFTPENYEKIEQIMKKYPPKYRQSGILPLLHLVLEQNKGLVTASSMEKIAEICGVAPRFVHECATFYTMFNRQEVGKFHLLVCVTTPCMVSGCDNLLETLEEHLGVGMHETTEDKMFTIGEMECLGACVNAPMIAVADYSRSPDHFSYDYYEDLTSERLIEIVEEFRQGKKPKPGPQNGRINCEPKGGKKTLLSEPMGPYCVNPILEKASKTSSETPKQDEPATPEPTKKAEPEKTSESSTKSTKKAEAEKTQAATKKESTKTASKTATKTTKKATTKQASKETKKEDPPKKRGRGRPRKKKE